MYIESSSPRKLNDTAKLISSVVPGTTAHSGKCLSFWYHMYGAHISTLSVYLRNGSHDTLLWSRAGTHGNKWLQAVVTVNSSTHFQVKHAIFCKKKSTKKKSWQVLNWNRSFTRNCHGWPGDFDSGLSSPSPHRYPLKSEIFFRCAFSGFE